jgi:hypothetical protein
VEIRTILPQRRQRKKLPQRHKGKKRKEHKEERDLEEKNEKIHHKKIWFSKSTGAVYPSAFAVISPLLLKKPAGQRESSRCGRTFCEHTFGKLTG